MRVLLLSAYAAQSHRYWQQGLQSMFPDWDWMELNLPPRHFSWRVRGNPLFWSIAESATLQQPYDLLIATSMVDLATLRGLVPALATIPSALYFHENQFDYPQQGSQQSLVEAQMVSLYSSLAATRLLFNSRFNLETFMQGCDALLRRLPDYVPTGVVKSLRDKAAVLPVPLWDAHFTDVVPYWPARPCCVLDRETLSIASASSRRSDRQATGRPLRILWSGRFEYDKGGEGLLAILRILSREDIEFELAITGQQFRNSPPVFGVIEREFSAQLVQFGYLECAAQLRGLQCAADIVLSTALHEFQGLAVMEAVSAGCVPLVPDRLAYTEIYPEKFRYQSNASEPHREAASAVERILSIELDLRGGKVQPPSLAAWSTVALQTAYEIEFRELRT